MSNKKLQKMADVHQQNLLRFIEMRKATTRIIDEKQKKYKKCMLDAVKDMKSNVPKALGGGMRARLLKADITVAMSSRSVIRMNEFYHRMMIILIEDTLLGVNYNPDRVNNLIPQEFSDLITNMSKISGDVAHVSGKLRSKEAQETIHLLYRLLWRLEDLDKEAIKKFFQEDGIKAKLF